MAGLVPPPVAPILILIIGDLRIACAVLDDEHGNTRVLTQEGFLNAIGRAGKAKGGEGAGVDGKPAFLRAKNLEDFISNDLVASTTPLEFIPLRSPGYQGRAFGYRARLLPDVCWVYQDALVAGKLLPSQKHIGTACRDFLKALTNHAIDDLVDFATGFEDMRKRRAIDRIVDKYVEKSARPWVEKKPFSPGSYPGNRGVRIPPALPFPLRDSTNMTIADRVSRRAAARP